TIVRHFRLGALALLPMLLLAGCADRGPTRVTVKGNVTYQGKPLHSGLLQFVGPESYSVASVQPDSTVIITDVAPGEIKVGVLEAPQSSGSSSGEKTASSGPAPMNLPPKYRDPAKSGVKYLVTA